MPDNDMISTLLTGINKRVKAIGADVPAFRLSDNVSDFVVERIPTGNPKIDGLMHGGAPKGRIIEVFGPESSGKTTLILTIIAGAIRKNPNCCVLFIDSENALDLDYARRIGMKTENVIVQQPDYGEQCLELVKQACLEKIENKALANQEIIIAVDSVAALVPKSEFEESQIGDSGGMARQAQMMSVAMRQLVRPINESNCCALFTNQIRDNVGSPYSVASTPGGRALKFYSSIRLQTAKLGKWESGEGIKAKLTVVKSKLFPPFKSVEFHIGSSGIDSWMDLLEDGIKSGILDKKGASISYGTQKLGVGFMNAKEFLKSNTEIAQKLVNELATTPAKSSKIEVEVLDDVEDAKELLSA